MSTNLLIVDDDTTFTKSLTKMLCDKPYLVNTVSSPQDAISKLQIHSYDVILLDHTFPQSTGFDLLTYLAETDSRSKVLMISQLCQCTHRILALKKGVDDFLPKPFHPEELVLKLEKMIQHKHGTKNQHIQTRHFTLDSYSGKLQLQDKIIKLRRKEFEILTLLIRNKNTILTKNLIVEQIWNTDTMPLSATVDVHIRRIRLQIEDYRKEIIQTVYGVGYMFVE